MTPDEVRMMDNRLALLFIRGERPIMDEKYDILKHPSVALTTDGKAPPYEHGGTDLAVATLAIGDTPAPGAPELDAAEDDTFELLSNDEIEALFNLI